MGSSPAILERDREECVVETIIQNEPLQFKDVDINKRKRIERMARRMTRMMMKEIAKAIGIPPETTRDAVGRINDEERGLLREMERASTIDEVMDVYIESPIGSTVELKILEKWLDLAVTANEVGDVYNASPYGSEIERKAMQKLITFF